MNYDAEVRLISFTSGGVPTSYYYDGEGHRVMTQNPAGTTVFVYDAAGNLAAEYSSQPQSSLCATCYLTTDHLGSTRVVTDEHGCAVYRADYLPFGELILTSSTSPRFFATSPNCSSPMMANGYLAPSPVRPQFTGKERDAETGLDYFGARYMSSAQGRFTSPDELTTGAGGAYEPSGYRSIEPRPLPYADTNNPQSLNKYTYALNNPLRYVDPDGHCVTGLDTLFCLAVGVGAAEVVTGLYETKVEWDAAAISGTYAAQLRERAMDVCVRGSSECGAAINAYQAAVKEFLKHYSKLGKLAVLFPGTSATGPLPTSKSDLAVGGVLSIGIGLLESDQHSDSKRKADKRNDTDDKPTPNKKKQDCLLNRDGTCVE